MAQQGAVPRLAPPVPSVMRPSPFPSGPPAIPLRAKASPSGAHQHCSACHKGHKGSSAQTRVVPGRKAPRGAQAAPSDQVCLSCHEGPRLGTAANEAPKLPPVGGEVSGHLRGRNGARSDEGYVRTVQAGRRVVRLTLACSGCHDPHGKERGRLLTTAFDTRGQLLDRRTQTVADVCFGCHAGPEAVRLPSGVSDLGAFFARNAGSSHTIGSTAAGRPDRPSLRTSTFQGRLDCTSCHDNPDPSGARGPHVSSNASLLKAAFGREKDLARLGERANDLCFLCHDKQSIVSNQSFPFHRQHLTGFTQGGSTAPRRQASGLSEAQAVLGIRSPKDFRPGRGGAYLPGYGEPTVCATCHASHGSPRQAGLVEFDRTVVSASSLGGISFQPSGLGRGTCTLSCHGYDHVQTRY